MDSNISYCKCGKEKPRNKRYCSKECNPNFGKKRPEHGRLLKERAAAGNLKGLILKGQKLNKKVNSEEFKLKVMNTAGWDINPDLSVKENFAKYNSWKTRNPAARLKTVLSVLKVLDEDLSELFYRRLGETQLNVDNITEYFPILWSLRTIHYSRRSEGKENKRYKGSYLKVKKHSRGITAVHTRSSYETNMIKLFESQEQIWDYESITLPCVDGMKHYRPDFFIIRNGTGYLIEVKGTLFREKETDYIQNKLRAGYNYCEENNMKFILTFENHPKDFSFLKKDEITEEFFKC